ncbi:MAG: hypothetical protein K4571_18880 [Deltaproteobacteria bacterium]
MLRLKLTVLIFIIAAGSVFAADPSVPGRQADPRDVTLYLNARAVTHAEYGTTKANNHLRVWSRDAKEMSFSLTTISSEYQECLMEGKATRAGDGPYEYRENTCRMAFAFGSDAVDVRVTGADGQYCRCGDLRPDHGCGSRTTIDSGAYQKARIITPMHPR